MPRRPASNLQATPSIGDPARTAEPLADQARRLLVKAQALSARLAALNETAVAIQASLHIDDVLRVVAREARWVLDFQRCSVARPEGQGYYELVVQGDAKPQVEGPLRPARSGAIGRVLRTGQALMLRRLTAEDQAPPDAQSALILPLHSDNQVIGTLNFYARTADCYTMDDLRIAHALAVQMATAFQKARLFTAATSARDELNTVLESISDAVLVINRAGRVLLINDALRHMLDLPNVAWAGKRALGLARGMRRRVSRDTLREMRDAWRSGRAGGTVRLGDGRHIEWTTTNLKGTRPADGFVLTFRDVSARVEVEQLREDMISMLVHDLRTPLTGIMLGLDMLRPDLGAQLDEEYLAVLNQTREGAHRLLLQINTILDTRKIEAGRLNLVRQHCEVGDIVGAVLAQLAPIARQQQQIISVDIPADLPDVLVDLDMMRRVLENILGNGLKFAPSGGRLDVRASRSAAGMLLVEVQDDGPGVPADMHGRIFEKYGQVGADSAHRGTGLGLTFCKLVVEAHGGQIGVRGAPGRGSVFWFTLPPA